MNHLKQIVQKLEEYQLDAMLITSTPGERYAIGFLGEGYVLAGKQGCHYSTDARYIEAAHKLVKETDISLTSREHSHLDLAGELIQKHGYQRVGFEDGSVSVAQFNLLKEKLPCTLVPAQKLLDGLRASKDAEEQAVMKQAQNITDKAFDAILQFIRPGMTEKQVAARLVYELLNRGADKVSFDPIVAAGANGSMPHAVPSDTVIEQGMFLTMDFGCIYQGYCSDMTRTIAIGTPTEEMKQVYHIVLAAQEAGIAAAKAGIRGCELDAAARQVITDAGYGQYFSHSFGHSVGLEIHEAPNAHAKEQTILPVGTVISAEPGIYIPGRFGVRIEDVLILHETGCEDITHSPKHLIVL